MRFFECSEVHRPRNNKINKKKNGKQMLTSNKFDSLSSFVSLSNCSSYYLFNARIQPPGFWLLFHLLFILCQTPSPVVLLTVPLVIYLMLESILPGFAYYCTCYLLFARHHFPGFFLLFLLFFRIQPPGFCLQFHLLFIL